MYKLEGKKKGLKLERYKKKRENKRVIKRKWV